MNAERIFLNRVNGCSREFNVLLSTLDRAGDSRLLDSMPRPVLRFVSYGPLNSFRNRLYDNCYGIHECGYLLTIVLDKKHNFLFRSHDSLIYVLL